MRKVTIDDISRDTGLSRGTVSRALNNRPDISVETRSRVLASCTKLNYVPSHAARTLATGRNFTLLVLIDDLQSPQSAAALRGVLGVASPAHYFVHVIELNARAGAAERIRTISGERIDGAVVLAPLDAEGVRALRSMLDHKPSASIFPIENLGADVLQPDHLEAGRAAARRLIEDGIRCAG
ncbi:MAG: LacI family DNA-binding transcriptional regulator, partial [Planctomycetes bacterium]|nr:LacI family DNA-binding transcriptional regulator [Planctomycetota bacterium]